MSLTRFILWKLYQYIDTVILMKITDNVYYKKELSHVKISHRADAGAY